MENLKILFEFCKKNPKLYKQLTELCAYALDARIASATATKTKIKTGSCSTQEITNLHECRSKFDTAKNLIVSQLPIINFDAPEKLLSIENICNFLA